MSARGAAPRATRTGAEARAARFADVFWNYHSADNSSDYDYGFNGNVTHFLALAREHDLFVLWRFGPYVCAEWDYGGLPVWLGFEEDIVFRSYNQAWMDAMGVSVSKPSWLSKVRRQRLSTMFTSYPRLLRCSACAHPQ